MADIFLNNECASLLRNKRILMFGDSNMRATYKDLIWLLKNNTLVPERCFQTKCENSFSGDTLVHSSTLHKGRSYEEVREYKERNTKQLVRYTYLTRCYNDVIVKLMQSIKSGKEPAPDIIIFNSCLWDISRWGPSGVTDYRDNMQRLMKLFKASLPTSCRVIWTTTLPLSLNMQGGFLVKQVDFLTSVLPYEVMEANLFARQLVGSYGFDVLDLHFHVRMQIHRRVADGIHWQPLAIRHISNLILTHICLSFGEALPGRARPYALRRIASVDTVTVPSEEGDNSSSQQVAVKSKGTVSQTPTQKPKSKPQPNRGLPPNQRPSPNQNNTSKSRRNAKNRDWHSRQGRYNHVVPGNRYRGARYDSFEPPRQEQYWGPERRRRNPNNNSNRGRPTGYPY